MIATNIDCPVCRHSTDKVPPKLQASDECKTIYPGIHTGTCPKCSFKTELRCRRCEEFYLTAQEVRDKDAQEGRRQ